MTVQRRVVTVLLFVLGFSFVESSVVVYLQRAFFEGGTNSFPMKLIDLRYLKVELIREAATIIVLIAVAMMLERGRWRVFWMFSIMFAAWDILYYIWLNILTGSPSSLLDWDILFLIPTPWLAPVIAPVLVSILLIVAGAIMLKQPGNASLGLYEMLAGVSGVGVIIWSFIYDSFVILYRGTDAVTGFTPREFHWFIFATGFLLCVSSVAPKLIFHRGKN